MLIGNLHLCTTFTFKAANQTNLYPNLSFLQEYQIELAKSHHQAEVTLNSTQTLNFNITSH